MPWQCGHHYPIVVEIMPGGKRARCLGCGQAGPVLADSPGAVLALRGKAHYREKVGARAFLAG
ncbi:MAG TPA: hypothetical protein VK869_01340 [Rubrobacteraceae bacterium]|nr:hypothetical protein [Rubrobacteraceae bacterium]